MKKIKVIRGGCGIFYTDKSGTKRHALKTPENGPFECNDEQAYRLVQAGVAVYIEEQPGHADIKKTVKRSKTAEFDSDDDEQPPQLNVADPE